MLPDNPSFLCSIEFMPHGHCYFWRADLITLHVVADGLTALAYFSIPIIFAYLIRHRSDIPFRSLFWLFGSFIVACGMTHLIEVYTVWYPAYWLSGVIKAITAGVSILSAVALVRIVPEALQLPSPDALQKLNEQLDQRVQMRTADLTTTNARLANEVHQREEAESEVRRLNESLQNRVTELQTLLDLLPVGIGIAQDSACRDIRTNRAFAQILGIASTHNASLSAPPFEAPKNFRVYHDGRELGPDELPMQRAARENITVLNFEETIVRDDGQRLQLLVNAVPLHDAEGKARGCVATLQDISAQKLAEQERAAVERRLQETQKLESLGVLAGGIAHDFNNLLTGILGNASLARLDLPPGHANVRASLDNLEQATVRAADLCKQMLAYAGKGRFIIQPLSLSRLVKETADLLEVSLGRKSTLRLQLANDLPAFQGDATQVSQILMNLVLNASEALGEKGGNIIVSTGSVQATRDYFTKAKFHEPVAEGNYVFVEISDNGCGMDKETQARIFDPFFTTKFTGRGLGLAAVMGIVRGHKGAIQVYSELGKGTTFKVYFPALGQRATPPAPVVQAATIGKNSGTILLVDDEDTVRLVAAKILKNAGYEVVSASGGAQAIELYRESPSRFSAVLLDLTMPQMGGEETFRALRGIRDDIAVVLMSGFNEQDAVARFVGQGIAGFLAKPFSAEMVVVKLREVLVKRPVG